MSLTLKYRPKTFEDVLNQEHITDILKAQISHGSTVQNYLFFGPRGTGKTTTARLLARALNCLDLQNGSPCNQCQNCKMVLGEKSMDIVEIDAASHTQVDNIREEILDKAIYPPSSLKKKVYIIDEVHMLSKASFNALLKIMEEPPHYLVFILATTEMSKIPETVASRSLIFNFKKFSNENLVKRLEYICEIEKLNFSKQALELIAKVSDGAMRDAIKYLEQISIIGQVDEASVSKFLGVAPDRIISGLIDLLKEKDYANTVVYLQNLADSGIDLYVFAKQVIIYVDEHFIQDPGFYSKVANLLKDIIYSIRNYPLPIIVFKTEIYKFMEYPEISVTNKSEKNTNLTIEKPIQETQPKKKNVGSQEITIGENIVESISQNTNTQIDTEAKPLVDNDTILDKLILDMGEGVIATGLKKYSHIDYKGDDLVVIIVTNEMFSKKLNIEKGKLKDALSKILNKELSIEIKYISSTQYLKNSLFG